MTEYDDIKLTDQLIEASKQEDEASIRYFLNTMVAEEIADVLEATPPKLRNIIWPFVESDKQGDILGHTNDEVRAALLDQLNTEQIVEIAEELETDDIAVIAQSLPDDEKQTFLDALTEEDRTAVEMALSFPEDSAGGIMSTDFIAVRADITLDVVLRYLRKQSELPKSMVNLFVRDRDGRYMGTLKLNHILTKDGDTLVSELVEDTEPTVNALLSTKEVARVFEIHDLISTAVLDDKNQILGRITIDDVVDIIREEAEYTQMKSAGLDDEDDIFAPAPRTAKRRTFWLGINLITASFAAFVISFFEATLDQIVALAIMMPMVASMGGVAGTQTSTVAIRALATGKLVSSNSRALLVKESVVGVLNGITWAILTAIGAYIILQQVDLSIIFGAAMLINLVAAAIAGVLIPLILKRMNIDPALATGLMITTVTDSLGFFVFLGLATIVLM
ncbi:MAG: magnesium transporter [Thiomicrospira sp.]|uniref:magnesium transporter n=1 Tax=Thiomicrospira sp. TaxID=935 RepID=UPI0019F8B414|nr:magnesium transporter [Thiomicrospira sp.]MBE0493587.1 magnesium transporter [Thiomicrospira sp.]